jgi:hypothetical protein
LCSILHDRSKMIKTMMAIMIEKPWIKY